MAHGKHTKRYPTGSMASANWQQFKDLLWAEEVAKNFGIHPRKKVVRKRIAESVQPLRDLSALREEAKQNRYAAELWKHHTETAQKTLLVHAMVLELLADKLANAGIGDLTDAELATILRDAAKAMREAR